MATDLQERLAEAIVKNKSLPRDKRLNKKELLVSIGYSPITAAKEPNIIMEAKGVKDTLESWGLTKELITSALVDDIKAKPGKRVKELGLGADILGMTEQKGGNKVLIINVSAPAAAKYGINARTDGNNQ